MDKEIEDALRRRALGFEADEVVEEFAFQEGEAVLLRRKVTKKAVPPDVTAAKMLSEDETPVRALTDEQLRAEQERLLALLREEEVKNAGH